jgi:antitoxin MazE
VCAQAHELKPGGNIDIHVGADHPFAIGKASGARDLVARMRKYRGRLLADFRFDRLDASEQR